MKTQQLPPPEVVERSCDDGKTFYRMGDRYEVCSWRPGPPNSGPPTQVHVLLTVADDIKIVLRLKSTRALDELVGLLLEYRKEVWP